MQRGFRLYECFLVYLSMFVARNSADKQTTVVNREARAEETTISYLEVVEFVDSSFGVSACRVRRETVATVDCVRVHHQSHFVQLAEPFQNRHKLILDTNQDKISRNTRAPNLHLASSEQ